MPLFQKVWFLRKIDQIYSKLAKEVTIVQKGFQPPLFKPPTP